MLNSRLPHYHIYRTTFTSVVKNNCVLQVFYTLIKLNINLFFHQNLNENTIEYSDTIAFYLIDNHILR